MALQKQNLSLYFSQGIDRKTDSYQTLPTKLLTLENGILITPKEFRKRNGYQVLGSTLSGGTMASPFLEELVVQDGLSLKSYSASLTSWISKGSIQNISMEATPIVRNTYQQTRADSAVHSSGIEVFTWTDSRGSSRYSVIDGNTNQAIIQDVAITNGALAKPMAIGNYVIILYRNTSNNNLQLISIPVLNPSNPSAATDVSTTFDATDTHFDACSFSNRVYVAYNDSDAGLGVSICFIDSLLNISSSVVVAGEEASDSISIFPDETLAQLWVVYCNGADTKYFVRDSDLSISEILAPTTLDTNPDTFNITGIADNGDAVIYFQVPAVATYNHKIKSVAADNAGTAAASADFILSVGLYGKAFVSNGTRYIPVAYQSSLQPTYFLLDENAVVAAKWAPSLGGGLTAAPGLMEVNLVDDTITIASLTKSLFTTVSGTVYTQTGVTSYYLNLNPEDAPQKVQLGQNLLIAGGLLYMYDGLSVVEHNFHLFPENVTGVVAAGGSLGAGDYQYSVVFEWTDNQGQIHRSAPSIPLSKTTSASDKVTLTIPTLRITSKADDRTPVSVVIYRTEVNGTVFYRITSITSPLVNSITTDTVTYEDTAADATIIGNPIIYTTGGVVENIAAPAPKLLHQFGNRVVLVPWESQLSWWFTKEVVPGAPTEFSDLFVKNVERRGGNINGLAELDEKLVFLKPEGILYSIGQGPNATGTQDDFTEADLIPTDNGCTDMNSVVLMQDGVMYKSAKGIYLLDRGLNVRYVGAGVEDFNADRVLSALTVPNTTQARFILDSGKALVYDYFMKDQEGNGQWSVFTNHAGRDACIFQNQYCFIGDQGKLMQETPGTYNDNGAFIKLKAVTSWFSFAGMQGFQRIYRFLILGHYKSPHQLRVRVGYDFNSAFIQDKYIDVDDVIDAEAYGDSSPYGDEDVFGGDYPLYQWQINTIQQKCESFRISIEDSQSNPIGEGMSISAISATVGLKKGLYTQGSARTVSG